MCDTTQVVDMLLFLKIGSSLVVQWLGLCVFTAVACFQSLDGELRFPPSPQNVKGLKKHTHTFVTCLEHLLP